VESELSDSVYWQAAIEHYHWDRMEDSARLIADHGIGDAGSMIHWFRAIEAEAVTRRRSIVQRLDSWLEFEFIPSETMGQHREFERWIIESMDEIAIRLGWDHRTPTRVAILAEEVDTEWSTHPYGYCTEKEPYMKICLPAYLMDDETEFRQAVAHEYAHVVSAELADGRAPRWLEEAVSVLVERSIDPKATEDIVDGTWPWLSPNQLELTLERRGDEDADADDVFMAYQQCGWIGKYLASLGDERRLGQLLREHTHEGAWRNLKLVLTGRDRADGALRAVYGFGTRTLFTQALNYVRESNPASTSPTR